MSDISPDVMVDNSMEKIESGVCWILPYLPTTTTWCRIIKQSSEGQKANLPLNLVIKIPTTDVVYFDAILALDPDRLPAPSFRRMASLRHKIGFDSLNCSTELVQVPHNVTVTVTSL